MPTARAFATRQNIALYRRLIAESDDPVRTEALKVLLELALQEAGSHFLAHEEVQEGKREKP